MLPLTESYLLKRDKAALQNYGRVRAVGSLAFILTATLGGLLLGRFGQQLVPALVGLTMLLTALAACSSVAAACTVRTRRCRAPGAVPTCAGSSGNAPCCWPSPRRE